MNLKQRIVLVAAGGLFLLSELYPPWVYEDNSTSAQRSAGYRRADRPPPVKSFEEMKRLFGAEGGDYEGRFTAHKSFLHHAAQRLVLIFSAAALFLLLSGRRTRAKVVLGVLSLSVAIFFAWLWANVYPNPVS